MKKLLNVLFVFMYFVLSVFLLRYYNVVMCRKFLGQNENQTAINIKSLEKTNKDDIFDHIIKSTEKYGLTVSYLEFKNLLPHKKQEIQVYFSDFEKLKDKIFLKSGRFFNDFDDSNKYISNMNNTKDPNQIGVCKRFSKNTDIYIRPIEHKLNQSSSFGLTFFYVDTNDSEVLSNLTKDLESKYKIQIYNLGDMEKDEVLPSIYDLFFMLVIPYFLICAILMYVTCSRYKEFSVYKINGMTNKDIFFNILLKQNIKVQAIAILINLALVFSYFCFFTGFDFVIEFLGFWLACVLVFGVLSIIAVLFIYIFLLRFIKISLMLKNKTNAKVFLRINYIFKFVSILILIGYISKVSVQTHDLFVKNKSLTNWDESRYYAKVHVTSIWTGEKDSSDFGDKMAHEFFVETNKKGGILADFTNYRKSRLAHQKNRLPYSYKSSIDVNNNYLQLNPIYDINNNKINIPDHDETTINLLVPEKYKIYEDKIKDIYTLEDHNSNNNLGVNIIYVKNNQKYFTYNLDIAQNSGYKITDPIVRVVSNNNSGMGDTYYGCALTHSYYVKIQNPDDPFADVEDDLINTGLHEYVRSIHTIYDKVSKNLHRDKEELTTQLVLLVLAVLIDMVLLISICANYLEYYKIKNIVFKINGVSFVKRYRYFYLILILIWLISYIVSKDVFCFKLSTKIVLISCLLDLLISGIFLKIYENKKISSVLKGE